MSLRIMERTKKKKKKAKNKKRRRVIKKERGEERKEKEKRKGKESDGMEAERASTRGGRKGEEEKWLRCICSDRQRQ